MNLPNRGLQVTSTVTAAGTLDIELKEVAVPAPNDDEVVIRVEAVPVNPSDLITMLAASDLSEARFESGERPKVTIPLSPAARKALHAREGLSLTVGLEGAGVVVAAGSKAQSLLNKKVAVLTLAAGMFAQYRTVRAQDCVVLPDDATTEDGASMFVNPLTALAMVETVRLEGHKGFIHTAAASNLGQMLVKICLEDGVPLVNVVRRQEQVDLLRSLGAKYVCNSSLPSFHEDLTAAIRETHATVAFDALGGGTMADQLLTAMEAVAASRMPYYSSYGSSEHKQVYIYGYLDRSPTVLTHDNYGLLWGVSGWLMPPILERVGPERATALRQRVVRQLKTTFASHYTRRVTLPELLQRDAMLAYSRQATGEKYLITPHG